ncbi:MAG: hypothetical protein KDK97_04780 [Verrucomicrobiales bacterium]|nr:hypothetical protein [Verrucomicrobiales bacterium]
MNTTSTTLRFAGDWPTLPVLGLAVVLAVLMWWLYRREPRNRGGLIASIPAVLRALAVFILVIALAGPVLRHITTIRQLGRVVIAVDASGSMKLTDAPAESVDGSKGKPHVALESRYQRAQDLLFKGVEPLIAMLSKSHDVEITTLRGSTINRLWWRRQDGRDTSGPMPGALQIAADATITNLDAPLREALEPLAPGTALVLLSDGHHNAAGSPEDLAATMGKRGTPIFTVGFGTEVPPPDLSLVATELPESVFKEEQLRGHIVMRDSMPAGIPATVRLESAGKTLWEQAFTTNGKGDRAFDFLIPVKDIPESNANSTTDKALRLLSVQVAASGDQAGLEKTRANNSREVAIHVLAKKRRVLILDGRPRWETRYIHNHFDRDERWSATLLFDDYAEPASEGELAKKFPATRDDLLTFDLILIGDVSPDRFKPEQIDWITEFVEKRGGGLIWIDGRRGHMKGWSQGKTANLVPVTWVSAPSGLAPPLTWKLESAENTQPALLLSASRSSNDQLWPTLPASQWAATVKALPGAQVYATLSNGPATTPAIVFRPSGAGAVLYLASDELWRWRYQVADLYHQRLWMQIASWIAAPPFQAEDQRIAIGTDQLRIRSGDQAEIRVRLRDAKGDLIASGHPIAFVRQGGVDVATIELTADATHAGIFHGQTPPLKSGEYEISVAESPTATPSNTRLTLRASDASDQELAQLTMNAPLLRTMANASGGSFLREEQAAAELPNLLQSIDRKQTITRETILWSSWWWFGAVIVLLTAEWLLRKSLRLV